MTTLTADMLRELLDYTPETGVFRWKRKAPGSPGVESWNLRRADTVAGCPDEDGYTRIKVCKREYPAQRLAWLYVYGHWPTMGLDHINRNRADNRIANLRLATLSQNQANTGARRNNKCGHKGVRWRPDTKKWQAQICVAGKNVSLGCFSELLDAKAAYIAAAKKRHGEFACAG